MESSVPAVHHKKILIVDDENDLVAVLAMRLSAMGYGSVETAANAQAGREKLRTQLPDVILLDIRMPGMSGWDFCAELKAGPRTRHIPVLFLTAEQTLTMDDKLKASGAAGVLQKPFELEDLDRILNTLLNQAPAARG